MQFVAAVICMPLLIGHQCDHCLRCACHSSLRHQIGAFAVCELHKYMQDSLINVILHVMHAYRCGRSYVKTMTFLEEPDVILEGVNGV
jgi:hypothetical protein